jgi:tetratricopeptide (TPR) repeat protein
MSLIVPVVLGSLSATAWAADRDALRKAAPLPVIHAQGGNIMVGDGGFKTPRLEGELAAEIQTLEKALSSDPASAATLEKLADLYYEAGEKQKADKTYERASAAYRAQLQATPDRAPLLSGLGRALIGQSHYQEGEAALRQAVQVDPGAWRSWLDLGTALDCMAIRELTGGALGPAPTRDFGQLMRFFYEKQPGPEDFARAQRLLDESRACYDKVVAAAPQEPKPYVQRGSSYVFCRGTVQVGQAVARRAPPPQVAACFFPREALADFQRAAELSPQDYRAIGWAAYYDVISSLIAKQAAGAPPGTPLLPDATQKAVERARSQLESLARSEDRKTAAGASEVLGVLCVCGLNDDEAAVRYLRRSLEIEPRREQARDMLEGTLAKQGRAEELIAVSLERVRYKDTASSRYHLAKAFAVAGKFKQAEDEVRAALAKAPGDLTARVGLAALLLRRADNPEVLAEAGKQLQQAIASICKETPADLRRTCTVNAGVYLALSGDARARSALEHVLREDPQHEAAKAALKALDP